MTDKTSSFGWDGSFENKLREILADKVFVLDTINVTENERAKDWADRFIQSILKPIEDGSFPTPNEDYIHGYEVAVRGFDEPTIDTPYHILLDILQDMQIDPQYHSLVGKTLSIVDKEYAEKKDVPEFHPGSLNETYAKTWYHSFSDDEKGSAIAFGHAEPTDTQPKTQEIHRDVVKMTCFECGNIREFSETSDDEEFYTIAPTGMDNWECEMCGTSNDMAEHTILSHDSSFTKPIHHEKLEKRFATKDLVERDFTGQDLSNVDFRKKDCRGAIFIGADLTGADFEGAKLRDADFERANIRKANFANAILDGAVFLNANVFKTDFSYASLVGADFTWADLFRIDFEGADLRNATVNEATIADVHFEGANLLNADLFRLQDYNMSDEEYEDLRKRGAKI
tara:strand:+ start:45 stop:1238 length:1194 start_codon:yes stop_codon:yes gene_type:complete